MTEEDRNNQIQELIAQDGNARAEWLTDNVTAEIESIYAQLSGNAELENQLGNVTQVLTMFSGMNTKLTLAEQTIIKLVEQNIQYEKSIKQLQGNLADLAQKVAGLEPEPTEEDGGDNEESQEDKVKELNYSDGKAGELNNLVNSDMTDYSDVTLINLNRNNITDEEVYSLVSLVEKLTANGLSVNSKYINIYIKENKLTPALDLISKGFRKTTSGYYKIINKVTVSIIT